MSRRIAVHGGERLVPKTMISGLGQRPSSPTRCCIPPRARRGTGPRNPGQPDHVEHLPGHAPGAVPGCAISIPYHRCRSPAVREARMLTPMASVGGAVLAARTASQSQDACVPSKITCPSVAHHRDQQRRRVTCPPGHPSPQHLTRRDREDTYRTAPRFGPPGAFRCGTGPAIRVSTTPRLRHEDLHSHVPQDGRAVQQRRADLAAASSVRRPLMRVAPSASATPESVPALLDQRHEYVLQPYPMAPRRTPLSVPSSDPERVADLV